MPYIEPHLRPSLRAGFAPQTAGELNYVITHLIHKFLDNQGRNYSAYNTVIGVLECAKLELYRRHVAPYEDTKIEANGDVP